MTLEIVLEQDEIKENLAYQLICETRESSIWNTMRRKRRWTQEFSESERKAASRIFAQAHTWHLVNGLPDSVRMSAGTLKLWHKLEVFCCSI